MHGVEARDIRPRRCAPGAAARLGVVAGTASPPSCFVLADARPDADVRGSFRRSLLYCVEWLHGYSRQFGLVAVDRQTFKRTPKPSAWHYARLIGRERG